MDGINTGIKWGVDSAADAINMSLGVKHDAGGLPHEDVIRCAIGRGVTAVAASGNDGTHEKYYRRALPGVFGSGSRSVARSASRSTTTGTNDPRVERWLSSGSRWVPRRGFGTSERSRRLPVARYAVENSISIAATIAPQVSGEEMTMPSFDSVGLHVCRRTDVTGATSMARFMRRASERLKFLILPALVGHAAIASAEDIPTVKITEAGPSRDIPLGPFYLSGTAPAGTKQIQAFVMRTQAPWLFGGDAPACTEVHGNLGAFKGAKEKELPFIAPGKKDAGEIWNGGGDKPTIATAVWKPKDETKEEEFSVYVNAEDFFKAGASYCVFVYREEKKDDQDRKSIKGFLTALADTLKACGATSEADEKAEGKSCDKNALEKFDDSFKKLEVPQEEIDRVQKQARAAWQDLTKLNSSAARANALLEVWGSTETPPAPLVMERQGLPEVLTTTIHSDEAWTKLPAAHKALTDVEKKKEAEEKERNELGQAIAALLVEHGYLDRGEGKLSTRDGKVQVERLRLLADGRDIQVSNARDALGQRPELGAAASDLTIPRSDVTLRDLLELTENRIRIDGEYFPVAAIQRRLRPILAKRAELSKEDGALVAEVTKRVAALADFIRRAVDAHAAWQKTAAALRPKAPAPKAGPPKAPPRPQPPKPQPNLYALFGTWLQRRLAPCSAVGYAKSAELTWPDCTGMSSWRGYGAADGPLGLLKDDLGDFSEGLAKSLAKTEALTVHRVTLAARLATQPLGKDVKFTQSTWLFSYATPVVGYGVVTRARESFNIGYYAMQIHFVPNTVNDPMWSHGWADFARFAAIELGASLPATHYGPGDRFRGWKGLPPFFVGGTVHVLPYTGISGGVVVMERRASPLVEEKAKVFTSPYVGMNVQINIPDLVRNAKTNATTQVQ